MHLQATESRRAFRLLSPITVIMAHSFWDILPICTISASWFNIGVLTWLAYECLMPSSLGSLPLKWSGSYSTSWEGKTSFLVGLSQVKPPPPSAPWHLTSTEHSELHSLPDPTSWTLVWCPLKAVTLIASPVWAFHIHCAYKLTDHANWNVSLFGVSPFCGVGHCSAAHDHCRNPVHLCLCLVLQVGVPFGEPCP